MQLGNLFLGRFVPAIPIDISEFQYVYIGFDYDRWHTFCTDDEILAESLCMEMRTI